jgi:adenylate kinase
MFSPPGKAGMCDDCGTALTRRKDDEPSVVAQRVKTYHAETKPLVAYYQARGLLRPVDASGTVDAVTVSIEKVCRAK